MAPPESLTAFLDSHRVAGEDWNIVGLGRQRGKYRVPENEYIGFLRKVYSASQQGPISLMERHMPERTFGPILIDLDFRFADDGQRPVQRRITMDHIKHFINEYVLAIHYLFGIAAPVAQFYVQQKPTPETDPEDIIKDGVHIMCSNLCFSYKNQFILRGYMMSKMNNIFGGLGCINDYYDMFHPSVIKQNNWFIYGCGKPDKMPYKLTYIHQIVQESSSGIVSTDDIPRHILNMSIRLFCDTEQIVEVCPERLVEYRVLDELWSSGGVQPVRDEADILQELGNEIVFSPENEDQNYVFSNNFREITWQQMSQWTIPVVKRILESHFIDFFPTSLSEIKLLLPVILLYAAFPQECIHLKDEASINALKTSHCALNYLMTNTAIDAWHHGRYSRGELSLRTLWSISGEDLTERVLNVFFHKMADGHVPSWDLYAYIETSILGVLKGTITTNISIEANEFITVIMNEIDLHNLSRYEHDYPPPLLPLLDDEEDVSSAVLVAAMPPLDYDEEEEEEEEIVEPTPIQPLCKKIIAPTIPRRIAYTLIQEQVNNAAECPIRMELLTHENAAITGCYHFFEKDAIASWFVDNNTCPKCREHTCVLIVI